MVVKINVDLVFTVFVNHPLGGAILNDVFTQAFHFHHGSQRKRGSTGNTGLQFHPSGTIGALAFGISRVVQNPEQYQKTDPNIEAIMNSCEVTEAQAETIWGILQECGVGSIEIISRDTMLDGLYNTDDIGYRIRTEDGNNPVLYLNGAGEVSQIRWANQTLYPKS